MNDRLQYIVEWRPAKSGEHYLFTQKNAKLSDLKAPPTIRLNDPNPTVSNYGTVRPVVVGTINPDTGAILYIEDQERR